MNLPLPPLFLAPMENLGARPFRKAIATIGGFDHASTEFIRVPDNGHVASLAKVYDPSEISPYTLAAQIMGSHPELMAEMTASLCKRGAPRIDLNCGCPSNRVTGHGAGSSLLKTPDLLYSIAHSMVNASSVPVSVKMRSGYEDTSLFEENLLAAQEAGAVFITLHPRTKVDGYGPPAKWELIAKAKEIVSIPIIGSGDVRSAQDVVRMREMTGCDGVMIGRMAVTNPWIFVETKAHFSGKEYHPTQTQLKHFLETFFSHISDSPERNRINYVKQLLSFLYQHPRIPQELRLEMLRDQFVKARDLIERAYCEILGYFDRDPNEAEIAFQ